MTLRHVRASGDYHKPTRTLTDALVYKIYRRIESECGSPRTFVNIDEQGKVGECVNIPCKHILGALARRIEAIVRKDVERAHALSIASIKQHRDDSIEKARKDERERAAGVVFDMIGYSQESIADAILRDKK